MQDLQAALLQDSCLRPIACLALTWQTGIRVRLRHALTSSSPVTFMAAAYRWGTCGSRPKLA